MWAQMEAPPQSHPISPCSHLDVNKLFSLSTPPGRKYKCRQSLHRCPSAVVNHISKNIAPVFASLPVKKSMCLDWSHPERGAPFLRLSGLSLCNHPIFCVPALNLADTKACRQRRCSTSRCTSGKSAVCRPCAMGLSEFSDAQSAHRSQVSL